MTDKDAILLLYNLVLSPSKRQALLSLTETPSGLFDEIQLFEEDVTASCGRDCYEVLLHAADGNILSSLYEKLEYYGATILTEYDEDYPIGFLQLEEKPRLLYCQGDRSLLQCSPSIAMVGPRRPTRYALDVVRRFCGVFAQNGVCIISGLARGIDTAAHSETLAEDGKTIGIIGCGLDQVYPAENVALYKSVAEKGLLITEYNFGEKPEAFHFPQRNRLISALSDGVFIAEAAEKSGTILTMSLAIKQGKPLFITPGNVFGLNSEGSNNALKSGSGILVTTPEDVLSYYEINKKSCEKPAVQLDIFQQMVYNALEREELHYDTLLELTQLDVASFNSLLTNMEIMNIISRLPGNYFSKNRSQR